MESKALLRGTARYIYELLIKHPEGMTREDMMEKTGVCEATIYNALKKLKEHELYEAEYIYKAKRRNNETATQ